MGLSGEKGAVQRALDVLRGDVDLLEITQRRAGAQGAVHPDGVVLSAPDFQGLAANDDPNFPRRAVRWLRESDGGRVAYLDSAGTQSAGVDYNTVTLASEGWNPAEPPTRAQLELLTSDGPPPTAQVRVNAFNNKAGGGQSGTVVLLDAQERSHWVRDQIAGQANFDGKLRGSSGYWTYSMFADGNFRFYAASPNTFVETQIPAGLSADGVLYFRNTGIYLFWWGIHTTTAGAFQIYAFLNSSTVLGGCGNPIGANYYYGNDGLGVGSYGIGLRSFSAGEHLRFGGWHTGGGNNTIYAATYRLPI